MIKDSMSYAEQDVKARMLAEQKVEAARVLESLHGALAADAALLSAAERQVIDDAAAHLSEWRRAMTLTPSNKRLKT